MSDCQTLVHAAHNRLRGVGGSGLNVLLGAWACPGAVCTLTDWQESSGAHKITQWAAIRKCRPWIGGLERT